ncbi:MAG: hypothetical protein JWM74_1033 [Myxococcaceae bacterium]|nr:hypothetical protein [Myxococcaceae bacterium]
MRKLTISLGVVGFFAITSNVLAEPNEAGNSAARAIVAVSTPAPEANPGLPTSCTPVTTPSGKKLCTPDADFAKRLCGGEYPDVALALMGKGTPFTRSYMTRDVDAWNATGGRTHRAKVLFDEEVMVVQYRKAQSGGIVMVSANGESGSYDVLRWDGSCVSVMAEEITLARPPQPKRAAIPWRHLDDATKTALLAAPAVKNSYALLGKACDGNADRCTKAESALSSAVVDFVRNGGALPPPAHRP